MAEVLFSENFSTNSSETQFAATYPLWTVTKYEGNPPFEVADGMLFLRFGGSNLGISSTIDASSLTGPIQIEAELGGGDGVTSQPCNYATILVIGNNNVVFHPGCVREGIRGHLRIDGPGGFDNQDVGWVIAEKVLHRLVVKSDGMGNFIGTLTDGTNPENTYTFSWTNAGAVGTTIGFQRYGHGPGDGFFSKLTIASPTIQSCVPAPSGLISWWPGDGNGSDIGDGNLGVLQGGATFGNAEVGQGFIFSGVAGERVVVPDAPKLNLESLPEATFEGWFKSTGPTPIPGDINTDKVIVAKHRCGLENGWFFTTGQGCYFGNIGVGIGTGGINVTDGQFHHFACIKAGTTYREYIDGVLVMTKSGPAFGTSNNEAVQMGGITSGTCNNALQLNGAVDEITVYQTALRTSEVEAIVSAGRAGKCKNDSPPPPENLPPVANAGASRQVKVGEQVVLDGSKSYDPEDQPITSFWSFLSRPAGSASQLTGAATLQPFFVPDQGGDYKIRLDITDPQGASASALVTITASSNRPPVAVIAPVSGDLKAPTETVLDGRGSSDPDGDPISFKWRLVSKPGASLIPIQGGILVCPLGGVCSRATLSGVTSSQPTLYMDMVGDYVVELTVFDTNGLSGTTQRKITALGGGVKPPPPPPPSPMSCTIQSGFAPGTIYTVQYVKCNGKQISPYAYNTSRPGYGMEFLKPVPGLGGVGLASTNQSVAYWIYETQSTTGLSTKTTTYKANCTRNPLATPVSITGTAVEDLTKHEVITDFKISGSTVTSKICEFGSVVGCRSYTKLLPSGCSTQ